MESKTIEKVTLQQRVDRLKSNIIELHDETLFTTDKLVELSLESGTKWQMLMAKVLDKGTDLFKRQQDITFNTIDAIRGQYVTGNKRTKKLLGLDQTKSKKAKKLQKDSQALSHKASQAIHEVTDTKNIEIQDNLKVLKGIGPKVEMLLNNAGIHSFDDLANASAESLQNILQNAGSRYQSMDPTSWKTLAEEAIANRNNE